MALFLWCLIHRIAQPVAVEDVDLPVIDHRRGAGAVGAAARPAAGGLPKLLAVDVECREEQLAVLVAGDVDLPVRDGDAGKSARRCRRPTQSSARGRPPATL